MLVQLHSPEVHSQAVLCSNLLVVCGKLEGYKVIVFTLNFQLNFFGRKKEAAKTTFSYVSLCCKQLLSGCDFLIVSSCSCSLPEIYASIKKSKPAVVLAIFKAGGIGIDRNTTKQLKS